MNNIAAGWSVIKKANFQSDNGIITNEVYERNVKWGIHLISLDDVAEAKRAARSHGFDLQEIKKYFRIEN